MNDGVFLNHISLKVLQPRNHPVQSWDDESRSRAFAITVHGDEGQAKRSRNMLVINWSPLGNSGLPFVTKFPFVVSCQIQNVL